VFAWLIAGLLFGAPVSATDVEREQEPGEATVEVEARLLAYEAKRRWCTYRPGAAIHGMGWSPWGRFEVTGPSRHAGRSFGVLFKCSDREGLLRTLPSGTGRRFVLVLPRDFVERKYSQIEDCSLDPAVLERWRPAEAAGRP
jgi:hypothetical protein